MADDIDMANRFIEDQLSHALSEIRKRAASAVGSDVCMECDDDIPDARKKLGFNLCISCAQERERKKQLFAG